MHPLFFPPRSIFTIKMLSSLSCHVLFLVKIGLGKDLKESKPSYPCLAKLHIASYCRFASFVFVFFTFSAFGTFPEKWKNIEKVEKKFSIDIKC